MKAITIIRKADDLIAELRIVDKDAAYNDDTARNLLEKCTQVTDLMSGH